MKELLLILVINSSFSVFLGTIEGKVVWRVLILQSIYIRTEKFYTYKFHVKKEIKP